MGPAKLSPPADPSSAMASPHPKEVGAFGWGARVSGCSAFGGLGGWELATGACPDRPTGSH